MTDWTPEEEEAFNAVEKHSNLGKQILRDMGQPYHFEKREWVGLTKEDMPNGENPMFDHEYFIAGMVFAAKILEEKNT